MRYGWATAHTSPPTIVSGPRSWTASVLHGRRRARRRAVLARDAGRNVGAHPVTSRTRESCRPRVRAAQGSVQNVEPGASARHDRGVRLRILAIVGSRRAGVGRRRRRGGELVGATAFPRTRTATRSGRGSTRSRSRAPGRSRARTAGVKNVYASKRKVGEAYPNGTVIVKTIQPAGPHGDCRSQVAVMRKVERQVAVRRVRALRHALRRPRAGSSSARTATWQARANDYVFTK